MGVNRSKTDQYQLRLPPGLREKIAEDAEINGRSMDAEIVERIAGFNDLGMKYTMLEVENGYLKRKSEDLDERRRELAEANAQIQGLRLEIARLEGMNASLKQGMNVFIQHLAEASKDKPNLMQQIFDEIQNMPPPNHPSGEG